MKNIIIIIFLWVCSMLYSYSQINISFDDDCLNYNAATMSKAMIETFGEDSIKYLLDNNTHIVFICNVDSLGHILKIVRARSIKILLNNFLSRIENYLIANKTQFRICFIKDPPDINISKVIESEREEFRRKNSRYIASITFPGEFMSLYEYEKEREKGFCLSKYDYLLLQINKYRGSVPR